MTTAPFYHVFRNNKQNIEVSLFYSSLVQPILPRMEPESTILEFTAIILLRSNMTVPLEVSLYWFQSQDFIL